VGFRLHGSSGRDSLIKQFAVRTHAHEAQSLFIGEFVDQQQIRLQVALAMADPIAAQAMVAALFRERLVFRQQIADSSSRASISACRGVALTRL